MASNRRTIEDMFDLGTWCGDARAEIARVADDEGAPRDVLVLLGTLGDFLRVAQESRNWGALEELRSHWDVNHNGAAQNERGGEMTPGAHALAAAARGTRLHGEPAE